MRSALRLLCVLSVLVLSVRPLLADELGNRAEIEKVKGMSDVQGVSYLRTSGTLTDLQVVGLFLKAYKMKYDRYPGAASMAELESMLVPEVVSELTTKDKWGTELRYLVSKDGSSYRLISAGADGQFDEASWTKKGKLAFADEDAVLENGELFREWTIETQPSLGPRGKLKEKARALLAQADELLEAHDHTGALGAYIEAVKADRAAADVEAIRRYAPRPAATAETTALHIAALRQFLEIHPGDAEGERDLVVLLPDAEAVTFVSDVLKRRPRDPEIYKLRAQLLFRVGEYTEGLADLEHATTLAPADAELFYTLGIATYQVVTKPAEGATEQTRDLIRRGLAAFERAESLRADYFDSLAYRALLLRELAKIESDSAVQQKIIEEADAVRQRAIDLVKARREKVAPAVANAQPASKTAEALRVGGDVKAPLVRNRVEPVISDAARKAHIAGIVIIEAVIDKEGRVRDAKVMKGLPFGMDEAAVEAVKQWTFEPGTLNGQPVDVIFNLVVNFNVEGGDEEE